MLDMKQQHNQGLSSTPSKVKEPVTQSVMLQSGAVCRGDGFQFDQLAFVASQGRNEKAQNFARLFRHSQLYEVFINERLKLASQDYSTSDNFECKVTVNVQPGSSTFPLLLLVA